MINLAFVTCLDQLSVRQCGVGRDAGDEYRIRFRRHEFQHLAGDAGVLAVVPLVGDDLIPALLRHRREGLVPILAVGVVAADEADGFDPALHHRGDKALADHVVVADGS